MGAANDPPPPWSADATIDGGDTGCGELVLELRRRFAALPAGARVHVLARDPGAPLDLPAWCRVTGHRLLAQAHPHYLIRRRIDPEP